MKNTSLIFLLVLLAGSCNVVSAQQKLFRDKGKLYIQDNGPKRLVNEKVVTVKLKKGVKKLPKKYVVQIANKFGYIDLKVPEGTSVELFVEELRQTGLFELVEFSEYMITDMIPNDTYSDAQWGLEHINIYDAWTITTGSSNIKIAVIDSEIDSQHEDLGYGSDNYKNIDESQGYNYIYQTTSAVSPDSHGTSVAGIIAAKTNNHKGIAGVAGGNGAAGSTIIPYCVSPDSNSISLCYVDDAIINAVDCGCKIINMSFGSYISSDPAIDAAIQYAKDNNVILIASVGNDAVKKSNIQHLIQT